MHLKKIAKNLIIEQHLYEYKKAPLERFTFLQISSELIFVHHWMVELGSVIKVKPGVTRGPLWHNWTLNSVLSNLCVKTLLVLILHCLAKDGHWYPYPALVFHVGCCFVGRARALEGAEGDKVL